jgi:hypothetical protein
MTARTLATREEHHDARRDDEEGPENLQLVRRQRREERQQRAAEPRAGERGRDLLLSRLRCVEPLRLRPRSSPGRVERVALIIRERGPPCLALGLRHALEPLYVRRPLVGKGLRERWKFGCHGAILGPTSSDSTGGWAVPRLSLWVAVRDSTRYQESANDGPLAGTPPAPLRSASSGHGSAACRLREAHFPDIKTLDQIDWHGHLAAADPGAGELRVHRAR